VNRLIGIDFDNTIACYNTLFYNEGLSSGVIGPKTPVDKKAIRDNILLWHDDIAWQKLQGRVYGPEMKRAELIGGVRDFIQISRAVKDRVVVISHKTEFANFDPTKTNLRQAALAWMHAHRLFDQTMKGFSTEDVFFEATRADKIDRINKLACDFFIDDLEEVLLDKSLDNSVTKILFQRNASAAPPPLNVFASWAEISFFVHGGEGFSREDNR